MNIQLKVATAKKWEADCALVFSFESDPYAAKLHDLKENAPFLSNTPALKDFHGKKDEHSFCYDAQGSSLARVLLYGLGKEDKLSANSFRLCVAKAIQAAVQKSCSSLLISVENLSSIASTLNKELSYLVKEVSVAAFLSQNVNLQFKSKKDDENEGKKLAQLSFAASESESKQLGEVLAEACAEAQGVLFARDLANKPANLLAPEDLAQQAEEIAKKHGFSCTVFDKEKIISLNMGALWAVAKGSKKEPRFIILEHSTNKSKDQEPIIFVGKGITFDTGGISLKPAAQMHTMKADMAGAAAIIGLFEAIGNMPNKEELPRIIGVIPTAENMPGGGATRPGDIVTSFSGQTIEILNTDAEGRLILCDALSYAQKNWKSRAIIDVATLTGACVVALGDYGTGVFTKNKQLRQALLDASDDTGDLCWPLPLWEEYDKNLDGELADINNIGGGRGAGASHAALFLQRFIEKETKWMHLDIAGPGYVSKKDPLLPTPGATGVGVRLFCELVRNLEKTEK